MLQKQKKPVRVGEGEQPKVAAKEIQKPDIEELAEKMKKAAKQKNVVSTCECGNPLCRSPEYDPEIWKRIEVDEDDLNDSVKRQQISEEGFRKARERQEARLCRNK